MAEQHCASMAEQHCANMVEQHCASMAEQHCANMAEQHCASMAEQHCASMGALRNIRFRNIRFGFDKNCSKQNVSYGGFGANRALRGRDTKHSVWSNNTDTKHSVWTLTTELELS